MDKLSTDANHEIGYDKLPVWVVIVDPSFN